MLQRSKKYCNIVFDVISKLITCQWAKMSHFLWLMHLQHHINILIRSHLWPQNLNYTLYISEST